MKIEDFTGAYKAKMIMAYPVIAGMTAEEFYWASVAEREAAFRRVLDARNLRDVHKAYLAVKS